ncbi:PIF1 [Mytilus coruscus]|uniref:PIF1 n=1 Tax=Mytilus coruscus TaxID=42192 RepID=A0A6J8BJR2_MYTCO|nr:PIF1 [Mytilus coruscus]
MNSKIYFAGEEHVYTAVEEGDVKGCSGEKELHLKEGCPVMLIVNLLDELVNGLTGKVTKVTEKNINVFFPTLKREVNVQKFSFTKYSAKLKRDVGCRMQFHLKLAYASTIHKAQGMTLDRDPETEQQTLQNIALSTLQDSIVDTRSYIQYVWEQFSGLIEGANLNSQDITNKNLSNLYKLINKELTSEENKLRISSLFGHNPSENEFNLIYRITSTVRKEVLRLAANPIVQEALKQAEEEKGKTFDNSPAGVGKIRYIAGWCLFKLMKKRKKGIMSTMYNRSKVHITEKLIREKEIIEHLEISQLHEYKDQESLKEIERKQNLRRGLTHVSDKCADFFVELDMKVQKLQTSANLNIHGSKFPNFIKNVLRNDKDLKSKWTHLFLDFKKEDSSDILDSIFEEILDRYTLMSIAQLRKECLEKKHTRKLKATRKQIKMRTEGKKSSPCTTEAIKNDTSLKKTASHRRLQSELLSNVTFLETNFKKTELNVLCLAYNMKGFKSESSTSAQKHVEETNPLSESVDHLEEEQSEQVSEITNQSGATSDREEEGGQSKCKQSSKRRNTTCMSRKRKSMGTKKGKGKKRKGPVKWPCGICTKDASSDSVG